MMRDIHHAADAREKRAGAMKPYHAEMIRVSSKVNAFIEQCFTEITYEGPELSADMLDQSAMMIPCTHRSQFDYFILGNFLHLRGVKNIRFAAGDNLTELPYIGKKFQGFGAFTVRRELALRKTYLRELCNEVVGMLQNDDNIIVFPEMGRSYSGAMMKIRTLILGAHVLDQVKRPDVAHTILPVAISYEQLPELPYFAMLEKGKSIRSANSGPAGALLGNAYYYGADLIAFGKLIARRRLGMRYGRLYVDYSEPIALNDILDLKSANQTGGGRDELFAHRASMQRLSEILKEKFYSLYRLLPLHVVAGILAQKGGAAKKTEIEQAIPGVLERLQAEDRNCKSIAGLSCADLLEAGLIGLGKTGSVEKSGNSVSVRKPKIIRYHAASLDKR